MTVNQPIPSPSPDINYRDIYDVINSSAFAVLLSGGIVTILIGRASRKIIKQLLTLPWLAKVPDAITSMHEDVPKLSDGMDAVQIKVDELLKGIDSLEKRTYITETQLEHIKEKLSDLLTVIRSTATNK